MEPLKYNPNAGGGGSYAGSYPYDTRSADAMKEVILGYRNTNFQVHINEAAERFGFDPVVVSNITSWDEFIKILGLECQTLQANLVKVQDEEERLNMKTLRFLIMCKYIITNYSPNSVAAKALLNSFMRGATIDFTPGYDSSDEDVSLRTFDPSIPVAFAPQVPASAHELERQIRDNELLMGIFATDSSRDRVVNALAESPMMCGLLPLTRDAMYVQSNPVEVIDSALSTATSGEPQTYLWWLTRSTDAGVIVLKTEMHARIQTILSDLSPPDSQSLNEFISSIGATDQTLAGLKTKIEDMCMTGYVKNQFTAEKLLTLEILDKDLIAGGILDMCLEKGERNGAMVSQAKNEFEFMNQDLKFGVVKIILKPGNKSLFDRGWMKFHPINRTIKRPSKIGLRANERPTRENVEPRHVAEFLKEKIHNVTDLFKQLSIKDATSNKIVSSSKYAIPLKTSRKSMASAEDIREQKKEFKTLISLLGETAAYSQSYLRSLSSLFAPYVASVRDTGANLASRVYNQGSNLASRVYNQGSNLASGLYNQGSNLASGVVGGVQGFFKPSYPIPNKNMIFEYRNQGIVNPEISAGGGSMVNPSASSSMNVKELNVLPPPSAAGGRKKKGGLGAIGEVIPTYVPAEWVPQQPPLQISNSRSANRNSNLPLGFSQQHNNMQVATPSTSGSRNQQQQHPAVGGRGMPIGFLSGFYSGPPVASLPLTAANLPRGGSRASTSINTNNVMGGTLPFPGQFRSTRRFDPNYKESLESTPASSRTTSPTNRGNSMQSSKRGGKPRHSMSKNKKTLRRNPRKLISRRQKYSRRK